MEDLMSPFLLEFYILFIIILMMIAYAGIEGTLRVFQYLELLVKTFVIEIKKFFLKIKLKRQLDKDYKYFQERLKEIKDNAKRNNDEN
jgi:hypothetical protein